MVNSKRSGPDGTGASARARAALSWAADPGRRPIILAGAVVLVVALVAWWAAGVQAGVGGGFMAAAAVTLVGARRPGGAAARRRGVAGGRGTGRILAPLERNGYHVLHDRSLPHGRADIDHLVIGPPGVVVVDSRSWPRRAEVRQRDGQVWIGERPAMEVLRPLVHETEQISEALARSLGRSVPVVALVAVHGGRLPRWEVIALPGVVILRVERARSWIVRLQEQLPPARVREVAELADTLFPAKVA